MLLNVPISVNYAMMKSPNFWLTFASMIMYKSIGLINALQFRRVSKTKAKWMKESQLDFILKTMSQEGDSSYT